MTTIINGRQIAADLLFRLRRQVPLLTDQPKLVVLLVGDDPASAIYVRRKHAAARSIGINAATIHLPKDIEQDELMEHIHRLNADPEVKGILIQLPLPVQIDTPQVMETVDPLKDVDGFHPLNVGRLASGTAYHQPCTPTGILKLLHTMNVQLPSSQVLVIGCSSVVGQPTAILLTRAGATVTLAHKLTFDLVAECQRAEVIITAAGCPGLVRGNHVRVDAVVIDVGINRVNGKIVGDVVFEECLGIARAITPVPGGVGPMTVACLLENTIEATRLQRRRIG